MVLRRSPLKSGYPHSMKNNTGHFLKTILASPLILIARYVAPPIYIAHSRFGINVVRQRRVVHADDGHAKPVGS